MSQIRDRLKVLARLDKRAQALNVERGLTRGIVAIALRQKRKAEGYSLRAMANLLDCSPAFLHDLENGRRWSTETIQDYVDFFYV